MKNKLDKLHNWLSENVISPQTPNFIALSNIDFNEDDFNGSFNLTLDNVRLTQKINFSVDISGKYQIQVPMHISPMGVPASFSSIELTDETEFVVTKLINDFFPKMKPFGLDKTTGEFIDVKTHIRQRVINQYEISSLLEELTSKNFQLKVSI